MTGLQQLDLSYGKITDAGLQSLAVLTGLALMDLSGCENKKEACVQTLRQLLPDTEMVANESRSLIDDGSFCASGVMVRMEYTEWCTNLLT